MARILAGFLLFFTLAAWSGGALAAMKIVIDKGGMNPVPIAVPSFVEVNEGGAVGLVPGGIGNRITDVITADLERSGLFKPLDAKGFIQDSVSLWKDGPQYREWRLSGGEGLVSGAVSRQGDRLMIDFFLYDVFQGALIGKGKRFIVPEKEWRYGAHRVADEIYSRVTGESGYFTSRIALVVNRGKEKWLAVMDQDGENRVDLTRGEDLVLTPRFSPDGEKLFYLSYETGQPRIYRWDIYSGRKDRMSDYPGLNSAPSWSPDGKRVAMTLSKDGNPEIYVKDLAQGTLTRLTEDPGIDTSPSWSPDGRQLVFNSDRGGTPQLYIMSATGGAARRLTYEGKYNAAPSWSPRGDLIAYVQSSEGKFRIAVIDPEGKRTRLLTDSWMDESPVWSPNGRVILFSRQQGSQTNLYSIDLTGHNERLLKLPGGLSGSDPSWSPLIP